MAGTKLSQAEAHEILRRQVERLKAHDPSYRSLSWRVSAARFAPGETILPNPSRTGCLGLVVRGHVAVHTRHRAVDRPLVVLTPGHTFGPATSTAGCPGNATLKALIPSEIWFLGPASPASPPKAPATRQRAVVHWRKIARATVALLVCVALLLIISVPSARSAVATVPMAIGERCSQRGSSACAEQAWMVAAAIAPADARPRLSLGVLYFKQGNLLEAKRAFENANALAPDSPETLNDLGVIYLKLGSYDLASQAFQQALALDPGSAVVEQNLGLCRLSQGAVEQALVHYQAALSLDSPRANTLTNMAIAYLEAGEPVKAKEAALRALAYDQASATTYTVLGAAALESQQPDEALGLLLHAQELGSDAGQVDYYLGRTYLALGQFEEARASFGRARAVTSDGTMRDLIDRHLAAIQEMAQEKGP